MHCFPWAKIPRTACELPLAKGPWGAREPVQWRAIYQLVKEPSGR